MKTNLTFFEKKASQKTLIGLLMAIFMCVFLLPLNVSATEDDDPETTQPPRRPQTTAPAPRNPFTPDGVATVLDNATGADKEFFTFTTPAGNVFFLVIDRSRGQDNVYFLNAVTEQDLLALASSNNPVVPIPTTASQPEPTPETPAAPAAPEAQSNSNGTMIFIVIAVAVFGAAAYYFKIVRPKKQGKNMDDEEEYEDEYGVKRVPLFDEDDDGLEDD